MKRGVFFKGNARARVYICACVGHNGHMPQKRMIVDGKRLNLKEMLSKLTPKQRKFAEGLVIEGLSKAEAYRRAYDWNGKSGNSMRVTAVRTAQKPNVALAIEAMEQERTARLWENKDKFQHWIMQGITNTISNTESDAIRLKGLELAGKTRFASVFEEPQSNESNTALSGSLIDNIQARLALLLSYESLTTPNVGVEAQSDVIDIEAHPVPLDATTPTDTPTGGGEGD
jgi:hypothetical protein